MRSIQATFCAALACLFVLTAQPARAWQFSADPLCVIWHDTGAAEMRVTYDPRRAAPYAIAVTLAAGRWEPDSPYAIRFEGEGGFTITTDRHRLSEDGRAVIAEDRGFGNVLRGLSGGTVAQALLGAQAQAFPLEGAAEAVAKFERCALPLGTS